MLNTMACAAAIRSHSTAAVTGTTCGAWLVPCQGRPFRVTVPVSHDSHHELWKGALEIITDSPDAAIKEYYVEDYHNKEGSLVRGYVNSLCARSAYLDEDEDADADVYLKVYFLRNGFGYRDHWGDLPLNANLGAGIRGPVLVTAAYPEKHDIGVMCAPADMPLTLEDDAIADMLNETKDIVLEEHSIRNRIDYDNRVASGMSKMQWRAAKKSQQQEGL